VANRAFSDLVLTIPAEHPLAINTLRGEAVGVGQMAIVAEVDSPAGTAAHVANQQLQFVHEGIPDSVRLPGCRAVLDVNRHNQFWLLDDHQIKECQFYLHPVPLLNIGQFMISFRIHSLQFIMQVGSPVGRRSFEPVFQVSL
jgi:hypothetical protein